MRIAAAQPLVADPAKLVAERLARNLSQVGLAKILGRTQPCISQIEAGYRKPSEAMLRHIALVYGIPVTDLAKDLPAGATADIVPAALPRAS